MKSFPEPDFRQVFESAPGCFVVLRPDLTVVAASDGYLRATLTTRDRLLGREVTEVFDSNPDDPLAAQTRDHFRVAVARVVRDRQPVKRGIQRYDLERPAADGGGFEERYWRAESSPLLDAAGEVAFILHQVEDVTAMVRLEQAGVEHDRALRQLAIRGEERLNHVLDAAPDAMIVIDAEGRIRFANAQTQALFGHPPSELIGRSLDGLIPERFREAHRGHFRRYLGSPVTRLMGSGLELFGLRKDGAEVPVEVSLSPFLTGGDSAVVAAIRDISERKRIEAAATLAMGRLSSAVESTQDAFALFDERDRLFLCNSAYRRLLASVLPGVLTGRHYEEVLEAWMTDLEFATEGERAEFRQERRLRRRSAQADFSVRTRDGRCLRVSDRRTPDGGIVETIWDLTEETRLTEELREARAVAEAASAAKSEFLSSMSHELRTPLNAILGFAQLLQRDKREPLTERHQARVGEILKGGAHLLRLIDDILDLSRVEAGRVSMSLEAVEVPAVLEQVRSTLHSIAASAGIRIELTAGPENLPSIAGDGTRFTQILMNFGSNAVKYNRPGGTVTLSVRITNPRRVRITISDTGLGIPTDKQVAVFQPFQRAGQETGPIEGNGIGLALSKRLAELMGGSVGFQSVHGVGSEFWVEMPIHSPLGASSSPPSRSLAAPWGFEPATPALILYVEDNAANVRFMEDLLGSLENIELVVASTAEAGVELASTRRPTVILLDINLPGMSGLDALRALRSQPDTSQIPVVALTAAATERDRQRGREAGFDRYLTKPIQLEDLEAALRALLT